jgi:microcystin degradation protein MlrC
MVRIAVAGFSHETNTFASAKTDLAEFRANGIFEREELATLSGTNSVIGGIADAIDADAEVEMIPIVAMSAIPGGLVTTEAAEWFMDRVEPVLHDQRPDAVVLDLHGAMVTERSDDGDGEILARVRAIVGDEVPVISVLDLHANVGPEMLSNATVLIPYDTYPHVDNAERGAEAVRLAKAAVIGEVRPVMAHRKIPMLLPGPKQFSGVEPTASIMERVHQLEEEDRVLTVGVCFAFPFADCPFPGMTVTVVTDGDPNLAESLAEELKNEIWSRREEFRPTVMSVEEAIHAAMEEKGPVVLADLGDNPGGGSAADGTALLWGLLDLGAPNAAMAVFADREAVDAAFAAGVGATIDIMLGGKTDQLHGYPIPVVATVVSLSGGEFVYAGPMERGKKGYLGKTAVLACQGRYGNVIEVVVSYRRVQALDVNVFRSQGIDPADKRIVAVKSAVHFRGSFGPIARRIIEVDTPGLTAISFERFPYERLPRPIWPLDSI